MNTVNPSEPITVQVSINAGIIDVWAKWTKAEHIVNWNFAGDDWCCPRAENDLSPGGKLNWRMEAKDGSMGFDFEGEYKLIEPHKTIEYEIADGRKVTLRFETADNKTIVTETFDPESINSRELQQQGWQMILNNFKNYCES